MVGAANDQRHLRTRCRSRGRTSAKPAPEATGPRDPLEPIGPERLRALREAIRSGTYPSDEHVMGGLARLFAAE